MILGATLPRLNVIQALGVCPFIRLPATWEEYTAGLSGELRYSIKRKMKTVEKQFSPRFEICGDISKIDGIMEKLRELHCGRMAEKKLTGASLEANFWEFHKRIAKVMLPLGRLVLGTLTINDSIVGCQYAFQYSGAMCYYQSGIDTAYSKYSIGLLLTALMIKEAIKMGLGEYDFLRGDESYKFHWTKEFRNNTEISMWNGTLKSQVLRGLFSAKQYAKSLVNKYLQPAGANYAAAVEAHGARRA
jgi:CelD/BcsL family acetyltransferase involved in cellulose biosynthesis